MSAAAFAIAPPDPGAIQRICVLGAGTMGSGIAAHFANLGFDVVLLDVSRAAADEAFAKARMSKPPHFMADWTANSVRLGGVEADSHLIAEADWVIEAVSERPEVKANLYAIAEPLLGGQTLLSTNTSGIEIARLAATLGGGIAPKFVGTHFFNPPRYLKLVELIPHAGSDPAYVELYRRLLEERGGRRVVLAKDTPGFIANRFGMWALYHAIHTAERLGLPPELVDALTGPFLNRPRSGTFRLADVIGIDVMNDVATNLLVRCASDPQIACLQPPRTLAHLLEKGWIGEKSGHGYTRRETKELLVLD
ncbi:MAG: 3-hydroxyacyl-CoA dehydrogenase, partial [Armatimonadota bacterium]